jgi:DNA (cytosine-5)-methyltransferase 1
MNEILRVGTDCSGIEAPIQALRQLGITFRHVFSSEIDKYCIQSIKANYEPEIIFGDPDGPFPNGDIRERDINDVPDIDLYVCGFPCQPFSQAGRRKGLNDHRGNVFWSCLKVIEVKQPRYFILENVRGILSQDRDKTAKRGETGKTWNIIWSELQKLKVYGYQIQWKVLNTKDYGIPQSRPRVFIVGTKDSFEWPEKVEMNNLKNYVDWEDTTISILPKKINCIAESIFIDLSFCHCTNFPNSFRWSPCLLAKLTLWCIPQKRYANIKECLMLQGFSSDFNQVVSNSQLKKQIGNSMSVNVLMCIIKNLTQQRPPDSL